MNVVPPPSVRELAVQGLWEGNPALVQLLGLCPLLAVSTSAVNALGLGLATILVLTVCAAAVSALRPITRPEIRLPLFVLVFASAVTAVDLSVRAWLPELHVAIGLFIPLIVTNCMILGRAEAFASRQRIGLATVDGLMMGVGFATALLAIGMVRELLGHGTLFADMQLLLGPGAQALRLDLLPGYRGLLLALLPTGAFLVFAGLIAAGNALRLRGQRSDPERTVASA
jgi:electron transport complex protein RnfE